MSDTERIQYLGKIDFLVDNPPPTLIDGLISDKSVKYSVEKNWHKYKNAMAALADVEAWLSSCPTSSSDWLSSSHESKLAFEEGLKQASSGNVRRRSFVDLEFVK